VSAIARGHLPSGGGSRIGDWWFSGCFACCHHPMAGDSLGPNPRLRAREKTTTEYKGGVATLSSFLFRHSGSAEVYDVPVK
jgi:hypothetical protein